MRDLLDAIDGAEKCGSDTYQTDCPSCRDEDQLVIWPESDDTGSVWCRECGWGGDGLEYVQEANGMSFSEALEFFGVERETSGDGAPKTSTGPNSPDQDLDEGDSETEPERSWGEFEPPSEEWKEAALAFCKESAERLWTGGKGAESALSYLYDRGLTDQTIKAARLGVNPEDRYPKRTDWGLPPKEDRKDGGKVWLPRGIVIPWGANSEEGSGELLEVNIRRPEGDVQPNAEDGWKRRKYQRASGSSCPMYCTPVEGPPRPVSETPIVLVEGEFDALAVLQEAGDLVSPVATGSASGAQRERWRTLLAQAPAVLVSFDEGNAGEEASRVWKAALPNAIRWPPHADDTGEMLEQGDNLRTWTRCGLEAAQRRLL